MSICLKPIDLWHYIILSLEYTYIHIYIYIYIYIIEKQENQ